MVSGLYTLLFYVVKKKKKKVKYLVSQRHLDLFDSLLKSNEITPRIIFIDSKRNKSSLLFLMVWKIRSLKSNMYIKVIRKGGDNKLVIR